MELYYILYIKIRKFDNWTCVTIFCQLFIFIISFKNYFYIQNIQILKNAHLMRVSYF